MESVIGMPFVPHVDLNSRPSIENPIEFLKKAYVRFYTNNDNLINHACYKSMGYRYDFRIWLKKFLYKQHGRWNEAYAPNKMLLRQVIGGKIEKIIEI